MKHYFTIQQSKTAFLFNDRQVVQSSMKIAYPPPCGLEPLLVMGVFIDQLPFRSIQFFRPCSPISARKFLSRFWSEEYGVKNLKPGISGKPDILIIDQRLTDVLNQECFDWLSGEGVQWEWSSGKDRRFTAKARQVQDRLFIYKEDEYFRRGGPSIEDFNAESETDSQGYLTAKHYRLMKGEEKDRPYTTALASADNDLDPISTSLIVAGSNDVEACNVEIILEAPGTLQIQPKTELSEDQRSLQDQFRYEAIVCVKAHPLFPKKLAVMTQCSVADLKQFLSGNKYLEHSQFVRLMHHTGVGFNSHGYVSLTDFAYIFSAGTASPKAFDEFWSFISSGGDFSLCNEVVPAGLPADPAYRLIYAALWSEPCLILVPRGSAVARMLDAQGRLMNYQGTRELPAELYNKLLAMAAKASLSSESYRDSCVRLDKLSPEINSHLPGR